MKIVLLGKSGMLGSAFNNILREHTHLDLFSFDREGLDITDFNKVRRALKSLRPDIVINCSAFTNVDLCETEKNTAFLVNSKAVGNLALTASDLDCRLIHFSTDYVFDGLNEAGYFENDETNPINIYGLSKLDGEERIRRNMNKFYIIRTSWLFGPNGKNFVDTMLKLAKNGHPVRVVEDQVGSPTFTYDLVRSVISNFLTEGRDFGIYHLTNSGSVSWHDFASAIFALKKLDLSLSPIKSTDYPLPAKRPAFSILKNSRLPLLRDYNLALAEYLSLF